MTTSKLDETLAARAASRARLMELKKDYADKQRQRLCLDEEIGATGVQVKRENAKLIELTEACSRLLHADVSGITGKDAPAEQPASV